MGGAIRSAIPPLFKRTRLSINLLKRKQKRCLTENISYCMQLNNTFRHWLRGLIRFATYLFAFVILALAVWVPSQFGQPSLEQLLYHAQFGTQGLLDTDAA